MSEQEKKRQRIYDLLTLEPRGSFFDYRIQIKEKNLLRRIILRGKSGGGLNKNQKEGFHCTSQRR